MADDPTLWTPICKMALALLGQTLPTDIETDGTTEANLCVAWYHQVCDEVLVEWPFKCAIERKVLTADTTVLTGSIDPTASTDVVGVGTLFLTELEVGDHILVSGETREVATITDNTHLIVSQAFSDNANDASPEKYNHPADDAYDFQYDLPTSPYCLKVLSTSEEDEYPWRVEGRYVLTDSDKCHIRYIARPVDYDPSNFDAKLQAVMAAKFAVMLALPVTGEFNQMVAMQRIYESVLGAAKADNPGVKYKPNLTFWDQRQL